MDTRPAPPPNAPVVAATPTPGRFVSADCVVLTEMESAMKKSTGFIILLKLPLVHMSPRARLLVPIQVEGTVKHIHH
jgi:hypothetical protein